MPLSSNETRRLLAETALAPTRRLSRILYWSHWRRHRQYQARACHHHGHQPPQVPLQY